MRNPNCKKVTKAGNPNTLWMCAFMQSTDFWLPQPISIIEY